MNPKNSYIRVKAKIEGIVAAKEALLAKIGDADARIEIVATLGQLEKMEETMLHHYALEIANDATGI